MKREHEINGELPGEYRRLEYLESTGTQYIDTGYFASDKTEIDADFQFTQIITSQALFWCRQNPPYMDLGLSHASRSNTDLYFFNGTDKNGYVWNHRLEGSSSIYLNRNQMSYHDNVFTMDRFTVNIVPQEWSQQYTTILFGGNTNGVKTSSNTKVRLWSFSFLEGEEYKRVFVPAIRLSDNKPGLYDLCESICPLTGTPFYINAGTGEFLYK